MSSTLSWTLLSHQWWFKHTRHLALSPIIIHTMTINMTKHSANDSVSPHYGGGGENGTNHSSPNRLIQMAQ